MHGGPHSGSQVGGAEGEESQTIVVGEGNSLFNVVHSRDQPSVDLLGERYFFIITSGIGIPIR